jgi:hypothetical protein
MNSKMIPITKQQFKIGELVRKLGNNRLGYVVQVWDSKIKTTYTVRWFAGYDTCEEAYILVKQE